MFNRAVICSVFGFLVLAGCETRSATHPYEAPQLDLVTSDRLEKFGSQYAFDRYLDRVERLGDEIAHAKQEANAQQYAQLTGSPPVLPCQPDDADCTDQLAEDYDQRQDLVVVTGSRVQASNPSITNNQTIGVDEGDIVKQIDSYLVVLQDGRLLVADIEPDGRPGLALTDRQDVYRFDTVDTWYDEMLVHGRTIVVTGYSYEMDATEISLLHLSETGQVALKDTFYVASDDYFDTDNYATRIVGNKFIFHTPIYIGDYNGSDAIEWPVLRKWGPWLAQAYREDGLDIDREQLDSRFERMMAEPKDVYRPVLGTVTPILHTLTICDIGKYETTDDLGCETESFIAPQGYQFYVSETDIYLWTWPDYEDWLTPWRLSAAEQVTLQERCRAKERPARSSVLPSMIYRISINGSHFPEIHPAYGRPYDRFSIDTTNYRLFALVDWEDPKCDSYVFNYNPTFFTTSLRNFSPQLATTPPGGYQFLPSISSDNWLENRFTDTHFAYAYGEGASYAPLRNKKTLGAATLVTFPVRRPADFGTVAIPHSVIRLDRLGDDVVLTGYPDRSGLSITVVETEEEPRISASISLDNRFETEGRSHAFNMTFRADGSAVLGLPTTYHEFEADRWWWNSDQSDLSFVELTTAGTLIDLGTLKARDGKPHRDYECEVSCIDWYGNSRPIFTLDRIFALSGTDLIEGNIDTGAIREVRQIDMSAPLSSASKAAGSAN